MDKYTRNLFGDTCPYTSLPCNMACEVEWCSRICFEKRGNLWNYKGREWLRNKNGEILKRSNPECKWKPVKGGK